MTHQNTGTGWTQEDRARRWQHLKDAFMRSWNRLRGEVKQRWDRLSEDDIAEIEGELGRLTDKISQRYGVAREDAERQIRDWASSDNSWVREVRTVPSFRWTVIFLVSAVIAAVIGFTPLTELVREIARWVFYIAALGFVIFLVINLSMRNRK